MLPPAWLQALGAGSLSQLLPCLSLLPSPGRGAAQGPRCCHTSLFADQFADIRTDCLHWGWDSSSSARLCVGTGASFRKGLLVVGLFSLFFVKLVKLSGRCDIEGVVW